MVERCRRIFETLGERVLRAEAAGSGQAAAVLADFLRAVELLAAASAGAVVSVPACCSTSVRG